jgi:hypothetical protein
LLVDAGELGVALAERVSIGEHTKAAMSAHFFVEAEFITEFLLVIRNIAFVDKTNDCLTVLLLYISVKR